MGIKIGFRVKKIIFVIGICLGVLFQSTCYAKHPKHTATKPPAPITDQISYVIKRAGNVNIGVVIKNLTTGQMIYNYNGSQAYIPASNLKIFTAVAALEFLTPGFQYITYIASPTSTVSQGVLTGDLYLVFSGDPSLSQADINDLFSQLRMRGISRVNGNIYIDDNYFDHDTMVPAALPQDATFCFSAPVVANNLDHNCIGIYVKPAARIGDLANVQVMESPTSVNIVNQIDTLRSSKCNITATMDANNAYLLDGCIDKKVTAQAFSLPVQDTRRYSADIVNTALKQANINLNGQILFSKRPPRTVVLASHLSAPLPMLIKHMLKESDNLYANSIVKTLGARYFKAQGTWNNGTNAVMSILSQDNGVNFSSAMLVDGAGLSRENVITPDQMIQVLATVYQNTEIANAFISGLPIGGVDGTLEGRLTEGAYRARVYAKTGTMSDVSSLSGYVRNDKNQVVAFSILINGRDSHLGTYRNVEDTICKILILSS